MAQQNFAALRAAALDGRANNIFYRQTQLEKLQAALVNEASNVQEAIVADSGITAVEAKIEFSLALEALKDRYAELDSKKDIEDEFRIARGKNSEDARVGVGIVTIEPTTYTLFYSVIAPLSAALAAGNCVIVRLDTNTREVSSVLRKILKNSIDHDAIAIAQGPVTDEHILDSSVQVIQDAQEDSHGETKQIRSVPSLKTIAIVDRYADFDETAKALINARFAFGGKSPYAPDLVLVNEFVEKDLLQALVRQNIASGSQVAQNGSIDKKTLRSGGVKSFVADLQKNHQDGVRVVTEGSNGAILSIEKRSPALLQTKVNEPALVVHSMRSLDDAIDFVTSDTNATCLAAYHFGSPDSAKYLSQFIPAHISCINHIPSTLLVGPASPLTSSPTNPNTRYPTSLFSVARPAYINPSKDVLSLALSRVSLSAPSAERAAAVQEIYRRAVSEFPNPSAKRRKQFTASFGFFEHAFVIHLAILATSTIGGVGLLGWWLRSGRGLRFWR